MIRDPSTLGDLWIDHEAEGNKEEGRDWCDFSEPYLLDDGFTSVMSVILSKVGRLMEEGTERVSIGGSTSRITIPIG